MICNIYNIIKIYNLQYFQTLSLRDIEYHICSNNSLHYYEDLKHNTAIPSRLGYNLKVIIATDNRTQDEVSAHFVFFVLKKVLKKCEQVSLKVQYTIPLITNEQI